MASCENVPSVEHTASTGASPLRKMKNYLRFILKRLFGVYFLSSKLYCFPYLGLIQSQDCQKICFLLRQLLINYIRNHSSHIQRLQLRDDT